MPTSSVRWDVSETLSISLTFEESVRYMRGMEATLRSTTIGITAGSSSTSFYIFVFSSYPFIRRTPDEGLTREEDVGEVYLLFVISVFVGHTLLGGGIHRLVVARLCCVATF